MQKKLTEQGLKFLEAGQFNQAAQVLTLIVSNYPENADAYHMLGIIELERGNFDAAFRLVNTALRIDNRNALFYNTLGNIELHRKNHVNAEQAFLQAIECAPDRITYQYNLAHFYLTQGAYFKAIEYYYGILKSEPMHYLSIRGITVCYLYANQAEIALEHAESWVGQFSNSDEPYYYLGLCYYALNNYAEALKAYDKGLALFENNYEILIAIAACYRVLGNYQIAESYLHRALSVEAKNPAAFSNLGWLSYERGDLVAAKEQFTSALCLDKKFADPLCGLGLIEISKRRLRKGLEYFRQASEYEPQNPKPKILYAQSLLRFKKFNQGWLAFNHAYVVPNALTGIIAWQGNTLSAKDTLLVWSGDEEFDLATHILFSSMFNDLDKLEARVIILTVNSMLKIFKDNYPRLIFIDRVDLNSLRRAGINITHQTALNSLGQYFRLTKRDFIRNWNNQYLRINNNDEFKQKYRELFPGKTLVGIAWKSVDLDGVIDPSKSCQLNLLLQSLDLPGIQLIALQNDSSDGHKMYREVSILDCKSNESLQSLCSVIDALDIVISVDTHIATLAGALGKETHVLLTTNASWYWFDDAVRTLWFKHVRLWRQKIAGQWQTVFEALRKNI